MNEMTKDEYQLACLIVESLNLEDVEPESISPTDPLFDGGLGLDSIDALEIAVSIAKTYRVHLKADDEETRATFATLRSLSEFIAKQVPTAVSG